MKKMWNRIWERNRSFPVICAFLVSLLVIQILAALGCFEFNNVLPWIVLIFFMYGLSENCSMIGVAKSFWSEAKASDRVCSAFILLLVGNGLYLEQKLKVAAGNISEIFSGILLLTILYFFLCFMYVRREKENIYNWIGASIFAMFLATGNLAVYDNNGWYGYLSSFVCWLLLFRFVLECCWKLSTKIELFGEDRLNRNWWIWGIGTWGLMAVICFIWLLAFYPTIMSYDSLVQMRQVWGESYSNHHPWLHTMMIKVIYEFGLNLFGSENKAIALYSVVSISLLAFSIACMASYLAKKKMRSQYLAVAVLVLALSPINQIYSIIVWKDVPFAAAVLIFMVLLCHLGDQVRVGNAAWISWIIFVPLGFCVCFLRSNGLYVFLGMIPFLIGAFWKRKKTVISVIGVVLILGAVYKGPVFEHYRVKEPDIIESLSIPAQQIAAVVSYDGNITDEQKDLLSNIIDLDKVSEAYLGSPTCSDAVKNLVREKDNQQFIKKHATQYMKLWLELMKDNPRIYVRAFFYETGGYWYHQITYHFLWATYIEENGVGIERDSKLPDEMVSGIRSYLEQYKAHFDRYLSIGLYVYLFGISFWIVLKRKSSYWITYMPILGIWGTLLIATPVWADIRYAYAIYLAVPLMICLSLSKNVSNDD